MCSVKNILNSMIFFVLLLGFCSREICAYESIRDREKSFQELHYQYTGLITQLINRVPSEVCRTHLNETVLAVERGTRLVSQVYHSLVTPLIGVESNSEFQFGNFDECLEIVPDDTPGDVDTFQHKYCLSEITIDNLKPRLKASRRQKALNASKVYLGLCLPATCSASDINFFEEFSDFKINVGENNCIVRKEFFVTGSMIIYAGILIFLFAVILCCTISHLYLLNQEKYNEGKNGVVAAVIISFSVIENTKKLLQKSNEKLHLDGINGVKSLSMIFILVGHALLFIIGGPVLNPEFAAHNIKLVQNAFFINSTLFVDVFLLLSGFLFCRITLVELQRRRGKINFFVIYVFRYIRLTPAYSAVIAFYVIWLYETGTGPMWHSKIGLERDRCIDTWWLNILYINNYIHSDKICMFQSWYLSVDTQLFILAPILIYSLWKCPKAGIPLSLILALLSVVLPTVITYYNNLDPTLLVYADEISDISANEFFVSTYIKTHMRATAYVFGILTGYLVYVLDERSITLPRKLVAAFWGLSTVIGVFSMFSVTIFFTKDYSTADSSLYAGMHRLGWSLATAWLVLAVTTGNAGILGSILSARIFAPISRLTYCMYLTNGLVELYHTGTLRNPIYLSYVNLVGQIIAHIGLTVIAAVILCLVFESPIHGFEKILLRAFAQKDRVEKTQKNTSTSRTTNEAVP